MSLLISDTTLLHFEHVITAKNSGYSLFLFVNHSILIINVMFTNKVFSSFTVIRYQPISLLQSRINQSAYCNTFDCRAISLSDISVFNSLQLSNNSVEKG